MTWGFIRYRIPVFWTRMILRIPHKKYPRSAITTTSYVASIQSNMSISQPITVFSLLETTHTQPRIDSLRDAQQIPCLLETGEISIAILVCQKVFFLKKTFGMTGNSEKLFASSAKTDCQTWKPTFTASQIGGSRCRGATGTRQAFPRLVRWGKGHHQMKRVAIILKPRGPFLDGTPPKGKRSKTVMNQTSHIFFSMEGLRCFFRVFKVCFNKRVVGSRSVHLTWKSVGWFLQLQVVKVIP